MDTQFNTVRTATDDELHAAQTRFVSAKTELEEKLRHALAFLDTDQPISGDARAGLKDAIGKLGELFEKLDSASFNYYEKMSLGVVESNL